MRWLFVALFTTAAAFAAGQTASLPEGDGKAIVNGSCTSCHGLEPLVARKSTRAEWAEVVERMKTYGTALDAKQTTTVVDYLAKSFPPAGAPAPAAASQDSAAADAAGKALVNGVCASCHAADLTTAKQIPRTEWKDIVDRMKGYGTNLDDKQYNILLDYLEKNHGPKQAASAAPAGGPDPGKALLDTACSNCHDLDLVSNRTGTQAEWQEVVERMNGRGANVAEKDIPVLVQYLVKMYPPKK